VFRLGGVRRSLLAREPRFQTRRSSIFTIPASFRVLVTQHRYRADRHLRDFVDRREREAPPQV